MQKACSLKHRSDQWLSNKLTSTIAVKQQKAALG